MSLLAPFNADRTLPCRRADADPEDWFPESPSYAARARAVKLCEECPRRAECLLWSLRTRQFEHGILAGFTPRERREMHARPSRLKPDRPTRKPVAFGWTKGAHPANPQVTRAVVAAARRFVAGVGSRGECAARFRVPPARVGAAATVLRVDPDLLSEVEQGWVPLDRAYRYAVAVQRWVRQLSTAESEVAA